MFTVSDSVSGAETQSITNMKLYAAQNNGIIKLVGYETSAFRFDAVNYFELICNRPEMSLYSLEIKAIGVESFKFTRISMTSNINNVTIYGTGNGAIRDAVITFATVTNDLTLIDDGAIGLGFYNSRIEVTNTVNGNVYLWDNSVASGQAFTSGELILGTVHGNVQVYDNSPFGYSYPLWSCHFNHIFGNVLFSAAIDNGRQAFDVAVFQIGIVEGNVTFYSNLLLHLWNKYINAPTEQCDSDLYLRQVSHRLNDKYINHTFINKNIYSQRGNIKIDTLIDHKNTYLLSSNNNIILLQCLLEYWFNYIINANDFRTCYYKYTSPFDIAYHSTIRNYVFYESFFSVTDKPVSEKNKIFENIMTQVEWVYFRIR